MTRKVQTNARKLPSQQRSKATVDALLDAAARVLTKEGYDRASTNRIASRAGISVGSLYQYFPSKEALVTALIERQFEEDRRIIERSLADFSKDTLDTFARKLVKAMYEAFKKDPKLRKVLIQQVPRVGRLERMRQLRHEVTDLLVVRLELEPDRSRVRKGNLKLALFTLVTAVEAILYAGIFDEFVEITKSDLESEITDLILRYLFT